MKLKNSLVVILCLLSININAQDYYAPWTKSTIVNNTKYPIKVSLYYSIPGCKLTTPGGMPCTVRGNGCEYMMCYPTGTQQYILKPNKSANIFNPSGDVLEGGVGPASGGKSADAFTIELQGVNAEPVTIQNPTVKRYTVTYDGKTLSVK